MNEPNQPSPAAPENGAAVPPVAAAVSAASPPITEHQILNGGIEITVEKIDASSETVKVRQLPISLIGEWGRSQGAADEAYLIELLCDKVDRATEFNLRNARMTEVRVLQILQQADFKQIEPIEKRLKALRGEIEALEAKPRWSDTITDESAAEIRTLGNRLNKKKFLAQTTRAETDAMDLLQTMTPKAPAESGSQKSSSASPTSAASPSGM